MPADGDEGQRVRPKKLPRAGGLRLLQRHGREGKMAAEPTGDRCSRNARPGLLIQQCAHAASNVTVMLHEGPADTAQFVAVADQFDDLDRLRPGIDADKPRTITARQIARGRRHPRVGIWLQNQRTYAHR